MVKGFLYHPSPLRAFIKKTRTGINKPLIKKNIKGFWLLNFIFIINKMEENDMEQITLKEFRRILEGVPGVKWKVRDGRKFYTLMLPREKVYKQDLSSECP